jgi:spermidine synthase
MIDPGASRPSGLFLLAIALLSSAILIVELSLTRIFSVTMFYHFAFLAVSIALLGLSASAVMVYVTPRWHPPDRLLAQLRRYAALFGAITIASTIALLNVQVGMQYSPRNLLLLLLMYLCAAAPFMMAGACLTLAVSRCHRHIGQVYAADLCGAASGCLLLIPALDTFGAPGAMILAATLGFIASWLFDVVSGVRRTLVALPAIASAILLMVHAVRPVLDVHDTKGHQGDRVLFSKWNSFSRIAVYDRPHGDWALSPSHRGPVPESRFMDIDSAAATPILAGASGVAGLQHLKYDLTAFAYHLRPPAHALIIGPGGGRDLWTALVFGARRVDAIELNPIIVRDVMGGAFRSYSGDIYHGPGVTVTVDDGRSFVRRSGERYDLIQASLVDTWAATSAGAYALSENSLYTVDAFVDYFRHLKPDGVLTITRWSFDGLRLLSLVWAAGERLGWPTISDRVVVSTYDRLATLIVKSSPFTPDEIGQLAAKARELQFGLAYAPFGAGGSGSDSDFARLAGASDPESFIRGYQADITPTTDDRPFYFHQARFRLNLRRQMFFGDGHDVLVLLLLCSMIFLALFVVVPLAGLSPEPVSWGALPIAELGYFACLGIGFMLIEIGLMQRFVVFLGHPVYSLTVVLFTLLLGGGLGSALSRRWLTESRYAAAVLGAIAFAVVGYALVLPPIFDRWIALERGMRIAISVVLLLPLGLLLGMPLPAGVRMLAAERPSAVAWAWAINGVTSVLGASLAIFLAMNWGFTRVAFTGAAVYAMALVLAGVMRRSRRS